MGRKVVNTADVGEMSTYIKNEIYDLVHANEDIKTMSAQQLRDYYEAHKDDYIVFESDKKDGFLAEMKNSNFKNLIETDKAEIARRKVIREEACKNEWRANLLYNIVTTRFDTQDRTLSSFLVMDLTDSAFEKNKFFSETITKGTQEDKKRAVEAKLEQIGSVDFGKLDFADDANFAKSYRSVFNASLVCDLQNTKEAAERYGVDLSGQRFKSFCEKSSAMQTIWFALKIKQSILTNPFYDNTNLPEISTLQDAFTFSDMVTDAENKDACLETTAEEIVSLKKTESVFSGCRMLMDKTRSPKERFNAVVQIPEPSRLKENSVLKETEFNNLTLEKKLEKVENGEVSFDTADNFFYRKIRETRMELAKSEISTFNSADKYRIATILTAAKMKKEYTKDVLSGVSADELKEKYSQLEFSKNEKELVNSNTFRSLIIKGFAEKDLKELKSGYSDTVNRLLNAYEELDEHRENLKHTDIKAYYREMLEENITEFKKNDSTFEIKDEDKAKIITDERIQLHEQAKAFMKQFENTSEFSRKNSLGDIPAFFSRSMPYVLGRDNDFDTQQKNFRILSDMTVPTFAGDAKRKDLLLRTVNAVNTIEQINYAVHDTDKKRLEKCMSQYANCRLAFVCKGDLQNTSSCGFEFTPEAIRKFNMNSKKFEDISTETMSFIKLVASDTYLTMPTEAIQKQFAEHPEIYTETMMNIQKNEIGKKTLDTLVCIKDINDAKGADLTVKKNAFSHLDIADTVPAKEKVINDIVDIRRMFLEYGKTLADADHFYNLKNSKEYTSLLQSLGRAEFVFKRQKDEIDEKNGQQIYNNLLTVRNRASAYIEKYANAEKNKNRQIRYDTCRKIFAYVNRIVSTNNSENPENDYSRDRKFMNWIKTANKTAELKKDGSFTEKNLNQMLEFAKRKTDSLNAVKNSFAEKSTERNAIINLSLARGELTEAARTNDITPERRAYLLATLACCTPLIKEGATPKGLTKDNLHDIITRTAEKPEFREFADKFDSEKIAMVLGGYSDKAFYKECGKLLGTERNIQTNHTQPEREQILGI